MQDKLTGLGQWSQEDLEHMKTVFERMEEVLDSLVG